MSLIANFEDFRASKTGLNESSDSKIYTVEDIKKALEILDLPDYYSIKFKTFLRCGVHGIFVLSYSLQYPSFLPSNVSHLQKHF